jgi:hypothetical protein
LTRDQINPLSGNRRPFVVDDDRPLPFEFDPAKLKLVTQGLCTSIAAPITSVATSSTSGGIGSNGTSPSSRDGHEVHRGSATKNTKITKSFFFVVL